MFEVKRGEGLVKVYPTPRGGYESWTACWKQGKRRRRRFATAQEARSWAQDMAVRLNRGEVAQAGMTACDAASWARATELLQPTGKSVELAAAEYAEAVAKLGTVPLGVAVQGYLRHYPRNLPTVTATQVLEEIRTMRRQVDEVRVAW